MSSAQLYADDQVCEDNAGLDDQYCFDTILHQPVGAITQPLIHWVNRPTFQQVVEVRDDRAATTGGAEDARDTAGSEPTPVERGDASP